MPLAVDVAQVSFLNGLSDQVLVYAHTEDTVEKRQGLGRVRRLSAGLLVLSHLLPLDVARIQVVWPRRYNVTF